MRNVRLLGLVLLAAGSASGAPATPAQRLRAEVEDRARAETNDLFRSLCPEQCLLLAVQARVEEEPIGQGDPGFEALGGARAPVLRGVGATVVVDARLPSAFQTRVKKLVGERLAALGAPSTVTVDRVAFPVRNPPHLEAPDAAPAAPAAAPERSPLDRATDRLADAAPLLATVAILALALVVLGALVVRAVRSPGEATPVDWVPEPQAAPAEATAAAAAEPFPAARARRLARTLVDDRPARNAVVREALARGEAPLVARWVREMGEVVVEDVRGDPAAAEGLAALAGELVRDAPSDAAARAEALRALEGRIAAARLARSGDSAEEAFAFLEGVRPDTFAWACEQASPRALEVALRYAPAPLRSAALEALPQARRDAIAVAWATRPEVSTEYAVAVAEELRVQLATTAGGAAQADRVLADLLDGLSREEQDAVVARIAAEAPPRSAALLTESVIAAAPADLLAAAAVAVPAARLVAYLAGADDELRTRLLSACPTRIRGELEEELELRPTSTRAEFLVARRELLVQLRAEAARRGVSLGAPRAPRPRLVEGGDREA